MRKANKVNQKSIALSPLLLCFPLKTSWLFTDQGIAFSLLPLNPPAPSYGPTGSYFTGNGIQKHTLLTESVSVFWFEEESTGLSTSFGACKKVCNSGSSVSKNPGSNQSIATKYRLPFFSSESKLTLEVMAW